MKLQPVDLSAHINMTHESGNPAAFPTELRQIYIPNNGSMEPVNHRRAVVRTDTGQPVAIVSDRYALIPHQRILDVVEEAIKPLDVGVVPKGIYVDRQGARMRALYKFPALAKPVLQGDPICPCLKIENTYDGTSKIAVHIGAFRFVCTNLAFGGGGVFAGGFLSVHAGEVPIEKVAEQLSSYLTGFEAIVDLYRAWSEIRMNHDSVHEIFSGVPKRHAERIGQAITNSGLQTVYGGYNVATLYATHEMRSYRTAFDLLERINHGFQARFPVS
jgi:hypothetical protein